MKTARDRAVEFLSPRMKRDQVYWKAVDALELSFKEHARDQRHRCAESVLPLEEGMDAHHAHQMVMNARAPGDHLP